MSGIVIGRGVVEFVAAGMGVPMLTLGTETGIGWERGGRIVCGVAYSSWNGVNVEAHIAFECPLTRRMLWTMFDYPFNQLGAQRITCTVAEGNKKSAHLAERLGFVIETTLKGAHPSGSLLVFVLWKKDCRWLSENLYPRRLRLAA